MFQLPDLFGPETTRSWNKCSFGLWQVNNPSVPNRFTIREVRDCVDEVSLADSNVFSTIDLTSGFWEQSLEEESHQYKVFPVWGRGPDISGQ